MPSGETDCTGGFSACLWLLPEFSVFSLTALLITGCLSRRPVSCCSHITLAAYRTGSRAHSQCSQSADMVALWENLSSMGITRPSIFLLVNAISYNDADEKKPKVFRKQGC